MVNAKPKAKPLRGKRIVITRALEQARELARLLEEMGAEVLLLPMVGFSDPVHTDMLDAAVRSLSSFDWLMFTSANAVEFFAKRCCFLGGVSWVELPKPRPLVACVGPATAEAVAIEGWTTAFVATHTNGAALAAEMGDRVAGKRILLPRSDRAAPDLPAALRAAGAEVVEVVAYHTGAAELRDPVIWSRVYKGEVDVLTFASPSAFQNFADLVGGAGVHRRYAHVPMAAIGPATAAAIRAAGLPVAIEAAFASAAEFAAALAAYFQSARQQKVEEP